MLKETACRPRRREVLSANLDRFALQRSLYYDERAPRSAALEAAVRAAVASALTARQRSIVEAFFFEGRSQGDIARTLGITQQVVQKTLFGAPRRGRLVGGAIARLRSALAPHLAGTRFVAS